MLLCKPQVSIYQLRFSYRLYLPGINVALFHPALDAAATMVTMTATRERMIKAAMMMAMKKMARALFTTMTMMMAMAAKLQAVCGVRWLIGQVGQGGTDGPEMETMEGPGVETALKEARRTRATL
jgi:hypothetical protein